MSIQVLKTGIDGKVFSYDFETLHSAMSNIELMRKDPYTKFIDVTYFERVYNKDTQR